jgi:hypothetical protein
MKKTRKAKRKVAFQWQEEKYVPPLLSRATPHTGHTKILHAIPPKAPPQQRPAA